MARPKVYEEPRIATAVRLPASVHRELQRTAATRLVSVNFLVTEAVRNLLRSLDGDARRSPAGERDRPDRDRGELDTDRGEPDTDRGEPV